MKLKQLTLAVWAAFCRMADSPHGQFGVAGGVLNVGSENAGNLPKGDVPIQSLRMTPYRITGNLTLTAAEHAGRCGVFDVAAGAVVTLPRAIGSGAKFRFFCKTTITSNAMKVQVGNADDVMQGICHMAQDGGDTAVAFEAGGTADTISGNGSTTGGIKGDYFEIEDVASGMFRVNAWFSGTGTEATPFSAAVS